MQVRMCETSCCLLRSVHKAQGWGHDSVTTCVTTKVSAYNDALDRSEVTQLARQAHQKQSGDASRARARRSCSGTLCCAQPVPNTRPIGKILVLVNPPYDLWLEMKMAEAVPKLLARFFLQRTVTVKCLGLKESKRCGNHLPVWDGLIDGHTSCTCSSCRAMESGPIDTKLGETVETTFCVTPE